MGVRGWTPTLIATATLIGVVPSAAATGRSSAPPSRSARPTTAAPVTEVGTAIGGDYQPFAGDFDGDGRDDVFLYAPGAAQDYVAYGNAIRGSFTKVPVTVNGSYRPFVGDFNDDGISDVFWYGPGDAPDWIWYGHANRTFTTRMMSVSGDYQPVAGDFNCDGHADIVWYSQAPAGRSYIWTAVGNTQWHWAGIAIPAHEIVRAADFNGDGCSDLLVYGMGRGFDELLLGSSFGGFATRAISQAGEYEPVVGNFDTFESRGHASILWYARGAPADSAWYSNVSSHEPLTFAVGGGFINGAYRPVAGDFDGDGQTDVLWFNPASSHSSIWFNVRLDLVATNGVRWVRQVGTVEDDAFAAVAPAPGGGYYAAGETGGYFGEESRPRPNVLDFNVLLVRYAADGSEVWREQFGSTLDDEVTGAAVDGQGNLYVVGTTAGHIPGAPETTHPGLFITKYDANGNRIWIHQTADWGPTGIAVDPLGNSYVVGAQSTGNGFILAFNSSGGLRWRHDDRPYSFQCGGVAISHDGLIGVASGHDIDLYSSGSALVLSEPLAISQDGELCAAAFDRAGNMDVAGYTERTLPTAPEPYAGDFDGFVLQLDQHAGVRWAHRIGAPSFQDATAIAVDGSGDVFVDGTTWAGLPDANEGFVGDSDTWLAKFGSDGFHAWTHEFGGQGYDSGAGIAVASTGHVAIVGRAGLAGMPLSPTAFVGGSVDAFVAVF